VAQLQPQLKPAVRKSESTSPVDNVSCCECSAEASDENEQNNERLDDIAFDNHVMQSVYRKGSHDHL